MANDYQPRAGSAAALVITHLQENGGALVNAGVTEIAGCKPESVSTLLRKSVASGLLVVERVGLEYSYSLPEPEEEQEPEFAEGDCLIAAWSDGDVSIKGLQILEDGTVLFKRAQIRKLVAHMSNPMADNAAQA